jgi:hypothetical protein
MSLDKEMRGEMWPKRIEMMKYHIGLRSIWIAKRRSRCKASSYSRGAKRFNRAAIEALPDSVKQKIVIGTINKEGHTTMEKDFSVKVEAAWEERYEQKVSRGVKPLDEDELDELALTTFNGTNEAMCDFQ